MNRYDLAFGAAMIAIVSGFALLVISADARDDEIRHGPCRDESRLLATTAGSPNGYTCPNDHHRMRVEIATHPTSEEAAALVFCECERSNE